MSDLTKSAELFAQLEARREFRFESMLACYMRQVMHEHGLTLLTVSQATGLTPGQISDYRSDYKKLTNKHASTLANYFANIVGTNIKPAELITWQQVGKMVDLVEGRQLKEQFLNEFRKSAKRLAR